MIGIGPVYVLAGLLFAAVAVLSATDRGNPKRWMNAAFWGLFALSFLAGDRLSDFGNGLLVLAMVAVAGTVGLGIGQPDTTTAEQRKSLARKFGNLIFAPALSIPVVTVIVSVALKDVFIGGRPLIDPAQSTLVGLGVASITAVLLCRILLREQVLAAVNEGRRLMDLLGWAALLPQMLSALGAVFALAGAGAAVGAIASHAIPEGSRIAAVAAYTFGMALFTAVMGNAFAAFPVLTLGVGLPLIVMKFHGDPLAMSAIGMLSGFCGTLTTPMAANFNLVPAALLGMQNRYGVIAAQIPTAILLLLVNTALMYVFVFR